MSKKASIKSNIAIYPNTDITNAYIHSIIQELRQDGSIVVPVSAKNLFLNPFKTKVLILNWIENSAYRYKIIGLIYIVLVVEYSRFFGIKIIWVQHNKYIHDAANQQSNNIINLTFKYLEKRSYLMVTHGHYKSKISNIYYVAHPPYSLNQTANISLLNDLESETDIKAWSQTSKNFVIFGRMKKYKNLELVIKSLPASSALLLLGEFESQQYKEQIIKLGNKNKVQLFVIDKFVDDDTVSIVLRKSNALLVAPNSISSIISGSVFFSLTVGVPVILIGDTSSRLEYHSDILGIYDKSLLGGELSFLKDRALRESIRVHFLRHYQNNKMSNFIKSI